MKGYYSVYNPRGEKIADCGAERDAISLIGMRNSRWDGHYYTFIPLPGDIIDIASFQIKGKKIPAQQKLPTNEIVVNINGGVGGSWREEVDPILKESDVKEFNP